MGEDNQGRDISDSITLEESSAAGGFTGTENGIFTTKAEDVTFTEPGAKTISDILLYRYSGSTLTGSFKSDVDETNGFGLLPPPAGSTTWDESKGAFDFSRDFSNGRVTATESGLDSSGSRRPWCC